MEVEKQSATQRSGRYTVEAISRACDVLGAFKKDGESLRLGDVMTRTGLSKSTAFRILFTLERKGLLEHGSDLAYRLRFRPLNRRKFRFGYGSQSSEFSFSRTVAESIQRVAFEENIDVLFLNNRYCSKTALRNVDHFVREQVDLVIEFQTDENCAHTVSNRLQEANIPLIAVEIPHPGATYYGANNFRAGQLGGRHLARWCVQHWKGELDSVLFLELPMAGPLPQSRLTGTLAGLRESLPNLRDAQILYLNGNGQYEQSLEAVRKYLKRSTGRRVLVAAVNDPSAIGAARAFEEAGRAEHCAVMGQNASLEARSEMRQARSRLIGSVAYFPERYGDAVIPLALKILQREFTPPALFVKHVLVTRENIDQVYPAETSQASNDSESFLFAQY